MAAQELHRRGRVRGLARAAAMFALARADAAEIEAQRRPSEVPHSRQRCIHDVVVHRSAIQRMGMTDDSTTHRSGSRRDREQSFERELARAKSDLLLFHFFTAALSK